MPVVDVQRSCLSVLGQSSHTVIIFDEMHYFSRCSIKFKFKKNDFMYSFNYLDSVLLILYTEVYTIVYSEVHLSRLSNMLCTELQHSMLSVNCYLICVSLLSL